jgi:hypothetical protein
MPLDREKYRKRLEPLGLSREHEDEIIVFMLGAMQECVSAAFGKHLVQQALQACENPVQLTKQ